MTFDKLWEELCILQPRLREGSEQIVFTVRSFRTLMRKAYERGRAQEKLRKDDGLGEFLGNLRAKDHS